MRQMLVPALFLALYVPAFQPAFAGVPGPGNWRLPAHVTLVGLGPAGPDSAVGHVTCTILDLANGPVPGTVVTLDFSSCSDIAIVSDQRDPRLFTNCPARSVSAVADANGVARFTIMGSGKMAPAHSPQSLRIYGDGIYGGSASVAVLERDRSGGLTLADMSFWAADYFSGANPERADLDAVTGVNLLDLSVWAGAYFSGSNAYTAGPYCP